MKKNISILGSTGSIGVNTLRIVRNHPEKFRVRALAARKNITKLYDQIREFRPEVVCVYDESKALTLQKKVKKWKVRVVTASEGLKVVSTLPSVDQVIVAIVGAIGLAPIFEAIRAGKSLAIANKEPLVVAGELLLKKAKQKKVDVFPIDSEHSGLWQCLEGYHAKTIKKLILTSSGGPFRNYKGPLTKITPKQALKHPKWKMGRKITIDSATLMNKGLEVIEAANLFEMSSKHIDVLIHPEAIVHAMVEFVDGSHLAHLGITDMRLPIQYAMSYPQRLMNHLPSLDLVALQKLNFEKPKNHRFPCLELGYEASRIGGSMPAALNAANEVAVDAFLEEQIPFLGIPRLIEKVMKKHKVLKNPTLDALVGVDEWARTQAKEFV